MRRLLVVLSALALVAAGLLLTGSGPARAQGLATYRHVPVQVFGTLAVGMPDKRTVKAQRLDPATGQWSAPTTVLRTRGRVTCGDLKGAAASPNGPGVALIVLCDTPYYEDQAPVHSIALVTRDGVGWARTRLPGEAYQAPAVSPSATYAAWLVSGNGQYVAWSATGGFAPRQRTTYLSDQGGETVVADDTGAVTVIGPESRGGACVTGIHTRELSGATSRTTLPVDPGGCTEGAFETVDAYTVTGGGFDRSQRFTLARAGVGAPWALTRVAPVDAPGLVDYDDARRQLVTEVLDTGAPGSALVALGGPDRSRLFAQVYDEASQTWGPQTPVVDTGRRCRQSYVYDDTGSGLYVDALRCGRGRVVVVSTDARTWTVRDVGRRPWTVTAYGAALPGASATTVVTRSGVREFPAALDGPCDVVQAGREGELVRVHGGPWPRKVQVSTGGRFTTVSTARRFAGPCLRVQPDSTQAPGGLYFRAPRGDGHYGRLVLRDGTWRLRY